MTGWQKSHSTEKPNKIDVTSSEKYVYVRKDITETKVQNMDDTYITMYEYLEKKMTKEEFNAYSDIISVDEKSEAIEVDVVGLEEAMCDNYAEQAETNATVEEALIEIYELIEGGV